MKRVLSLATLFPNAHRPRFGTFVARQFEALAARDDCDVTVINPIGVPPIAFGRYAPLAKSAVSGVEHGVSVYRPRFTLIPKIGGRYNPAMIARATLPLARKLHAENPFDVVDAQFFYPDGPAAARIAAELGLPLSIKARGSDILHWGNTPYALTMMREACDQAAGLLSVSKALARDMADLGLPSDKITIHYTGLDRALFYPRDRTQARAYLASEFGVNIDENAPILTSTGALISIKGQGLIIGALAHHPKAHLLLVGGGPDRPALEAQAAEERVSDRVHFLGLLDHVALPQILSASDAMVLPSTREGLANAWVEALACGTPLVITDVGGARELVTSPAAGEIVERNAASIAEGIYKVLAASHAPERIAECATHFSWDNNAATLAEYYDALILRGHNGRPREG